MTEEVGGVAWEQGRAVSRMVAAMRAGDYAAMALAMGDYASALGTRVTSNLAKIAAPVLEAQSQAIADREHDARTMEQRLLLLIAMAEDEQGKQGEQDTRLSLIEVAAATALAAAADAVAENLIQTARIDAIERARDAELGSRIAAAQTARDTEAEDQAKAAKDAASE